MYSRAPIVAGKRLREKSSDPVQLKSEQDQAIAKILELAGNVEAVAKDYAPSRLGMYEAPNGIVFSEVLELFGYLLNRVDEPVPVLSAPIANYLPVNEPISASPMSRVCGQNRMRARRATQVIANATTKECAAASAGFGPNPAGRGFAGEFLRHRLHQDGQSWQQPLPWPSPATPASRPCGMLR